MGESWAGLLALVTQVGVTVVVSLVTGLFGGLWFDAHFGTKPWGILCFSLLGIVVGSFAVYRIVSRSIDVALAANSSKQPNDHHSGKP